MNNSLLLAATSSDRQTLLAEIAPSADCYFEGDFVSTEIAKKFQEMIVFSPRFGESIYYIGGDRWNETAQNALLKLCEEPPSNTTIIIGASSAGDIIPTLRSRLTVCTADSAPAPDRLEGITLATCDNYSMADCIEYVRRGLRARPDARRAERLEKALQLVASKKLAEKQIKEVLLLI